MSRREREERNDRQKKHVYASAKERADKTEKGNNDDYAVKLPKGAKFLKIKKEGGKYRLDFLPYVVGKGNKFADEGMLHYERTYMVHRDIGVEGKQYICLKSFQKACPICEEGSRLYKEGRKDESKACYASVRQLFNVIDLDNPKEGVQIIDQSNFAFGQFIDKKVRANAKYENFYHLQGGRTLEIDMEEATFSGNSFAKVANIEMEPREDYDDELLEQTYCLDEMLTEVSYKDLKKIFEGESTSLDEEEDKPVRRSSRREEPDDEDEPAKPAKNGKKHDENNEDENLPRRRTAAKKVTDDDDDDSDD